MGLKQQADEQEVIIPIHQPAAFPNGEAKLGVFYNLFLSRCKRTKLVFSDW
jgi:hypothetical protein